MLLSRIKSTIVSVGIVVCSTVVSIGSTVQFETPAAAVVAPRSATSDTPSARVEMDAVAASFVSAAHSEAAPEPYRLFPSLLTRYRAPATGRRKVYGPTAPRYREDKAAAVAAAAAAAAERLPLLAGNQVLAFYGKPGSPSMGILGEYTKEQLAPLLEGYAKLYDKVNGSLGVVPAFYIIYGTCWPGGEIGLLKEAVVESYIRFAAERGWIVFLDHQLGKYGVEDSVRSMLPYLKYPNVHLAIDPEWRTLKPMEEIGSITGTELNNAQRLIDDYLRDNGLPGIRMLVVHQFRSTMIRNAAGVNAGFDRVVLVHTADGFGPPKLKKNTYAHNARLTNMPVKGFKLFFETKVVGAGWDDPLMLPEEVLSLDPMPLLVMYQ